MPYSRCKNLAHSGKAAPAVVKTSVQNVPLCTLTMRSLYSTFFCRSCCWSSFSKAFSAYDEASKWKNLKSKKRLGPWSQNHEHRHLHRYHQQCWWKTLRKPRQRVGQAEDQLPHYGKPPKPGKPQGHVPHCGGLWESHLADSTWHQVSCTAKTSVSFRPAVAGHLNVSRNDPPYLRVNLPCV